MRVLIPAVVLLISIASAAKAADAPAPPPAAAGGGSIAAVQQELKQAGYTPGPVNGVMTEKTRRAIAAYERRTGHPPETLAGAGNADPVKTAQLELRSLGLFAGVADGALGPRTRDAIIRFEASRRLPIDPRVSDRLLAALEQAGAPASPAAATPSAPPVPSAPAAAAPAPPTGEATAQLPAAAGPEPAAPEALGRRPLPSWVNPPPIR